MREMSETAASSRGLELTVNGRSCALPENSTVADLVRELAGDGVAVAVERNGEIVSRGAWASTTLSDDDRVELVRFVQGG